MTMTKLFTKKDKRHYIFITNQKAADLYKKSFLLFRNGIVVVKTKDGNLHVVSTDNQGEIALVIGDEPGMPAVEFKDNNLNQNWELLLGFLLDEDNAMLFFGERYMALERGIYKGFFENYEVNFAKKMAFHLAAFINSEVQDAFFALDKEHSDSQEDATCLVIE